MANALWIGLIKPDRLMPPHLDDGIGILTGADDDSFAGVDLTTEKAAVTTAQNLKVDGFESDNDGILATALSDINTIIEATSMGAPEQTTVKADIAVVINAIAFAYSTLKTNLEADLDANIGDTASYLLSDALSQVQTLYLAGIAAEYNGGTNEPCTRCKNTGRELDAAGNSVECGSCFGLTVTKTTNTPVVNNWNVIEEKTFT